MFNKEIRSKDEQNKLKRIQKGKKIEKSGAIQKEAHISSRNKRDQAKSDERSNSSK